MPTKTEIDWSQVSARDIPLELAVERVEQQVNQFGKTGLPELFKTWHPTLLMNLLRELCQGIKGRCRYPNGEYDGRVGQDVVRFLENGGIPRI